MNKEVNELIEEIKEVIYNPTFFVEDYGEMESMVTFEADECKTLLDYINQLEEDKIAILLDGNTLINANGKLQQKVNQLETNRDEAIEYIKNNTKYFDSEYVSIYGELCDIAGAGDTRTHCVIGDEQLLEILERGKECKKE